MMFSCRLVRMFGLCLCLSLVSVMAVGMVVVVLIVRVILSCILWCCGCSSRLMVGSCVVSS